jgi:hypothetical protein
MADEQEQPKVEPVVDPNYIGAIPPAEDKPEPQVLRSKEEQEIKNKDKYLQDNGPKVIAPPKDAPEPKRLVSPEEERLADGEVGFPGPQTLASSEHQKAEQQKAADVSPQVQDAPEAPAAPEALSEMKASKASDELRERSEEVADAARAGENVQAKEAAIEAEDTPPSRDKEAKEDAAKIHSDSPKKEE